MIIISSPSTGAGKNNNTQIFTSIDWYISQTFISIPHTALALCFIHFEFRNQPMCRNTYGKFLFLLLALYMDRVFRRVHKDDGKKYITGHWVIAHWVNMGITSHEPESTWWISMDQVLFPWLFATAEIAHGFQLIRSSSTFLVWGWNALNCRDCWQNCWWWQ